MRSLTDASVLTFGEAASADVRVVGLSLDDRACATFRAITPWGEADVRLGVSGRHMAVNAAAALTCVGAVGGDVVAGAQAMADVQLSAMRMEVLHTASGATVLNDAYNANPTSMRAAIDALAAMPAQRRVAVLGLMAEIADAEAEHRRMVAYARERGVDVVAFGTEWYGTPAVLTVDDAVAALGSIAGGDAVLVKGSRVVGLERLAVALCRTGVEPA